MNKKLMPKLFGAICIFALMTSCTSAEQKVETAEEKVEEAHDELVSANEDYLAEVSGYKTETAKEIAANDLSIVEFNARISKEKKETLEEYKKKIAELNKNNTDMKLRMENYKAEGKDQWETFKTEYNHDMEELGKAFKDLSVKNVK
ncbi:MAG: peptidase M23 [Bacteroidetes bacterium]|nr:peptidase M23 [Bacteroidota bacterium]